VGALIGLPLHPLENHRFDGKLGGTYGSTLAAQNARRVRNISTLLAFGIVCTAVLTMRFRHPEIERPFRYSLWSLRAPDRHSILLLLMFSLPAENWFRLIVWLLLGIVIYFGYGKRHSVLALTGKVWPAPST
jgi:APA family basic amino acid/polyamine antiporter